MHVIVHGERHDPEHVAASPYEPEGFVEERGRGVPYECPACTECLGGDLLAAQVPRDQHGFRITTEI